MSGPSGSIKKNESGLNDPLHFKVQLLFQPSRESSFLLWGLFCHVVESFHISAVNLK